MLLPAEAWDYANVVLVLLVIFQSLQDDDEADTVGCCTLKVENVEPVPPNILKVVLFYLTKAKLEELQETYFSTGS